MTTFLVILNLTYFIALNMVMIPYDVGALDSCGYELRGDTCFAPLEYEVGIFQIPGDAFDIIFEKQSITTAVSNYQQGYSTSNFSMDENWTTVPSQAGGEQLGTNIISFLDVVKIIYSILPTLINIAITPLMIFFSAGSNLMVSLLLGVPYVIILVLAVFATIRGVSD